VPRKRRQFGGIDRLQSGRYRVRVIDDATGERVSLGTFASKADAEQVLAKAVADQHRGVWVRPDAGAVLLEDFTWQWLASRLGKSGAPLRPRVRELYEGELRLHILPSLGRIPVGRIRPAAVRTWYAALLRDGPGPSTAAKCYRLLRAILNTAVSDGLLVANPCTIRGAGSENAAERKLPTIEQIFELANAVNQRYRALVLVAAFSGLRRGELFALRRQHVDSEHGTVTVKEQRQAPTASRSSSDMSGASRRTKTLRSRRPRKREAPWPNGRCAPRLTRTFSGERVTGIEPAFSAWEADVLPLNYTRMRTAAYAGRPRADRSGRRG